MCVCVGLCICMCVFVECWRVGARAVGSDCAVGFGITLLSLSTSLSEWVPTPVWCLENFMDSGAWKATVHGVPKSQM